MAVFDSDIRWHEYCADGQLVSGGAVRFRLCALLSHPVETRRNAMWTHLLSGKYEFPPKCSGLDNILWLENALQLLNLTLS